MNWHLIFWVASACCFCFSRLCLLQSHQNWAILTFIGQSLAVCPVRPHVLHRRFLTRHVSACCFCFLQNRQALPAGIDVRQSFMSWPGSLHMMHTTLQIWYNNYKDTVKVFIFAGLIFTNCQRLPFLLGFISRSKHLINLVIIVLIWVNVLSHPVVYK